MFPLLSCVRIVVPSPSNECGVNSCVSNENCHNRGDVASLNQIDFFPSNNGKRGFASSGNS